jgi:DNA polymerase-3 subunit delta
MIGTGPGNKGSKAIKEYCSQPDENKLLIFSAEKLERKAQSSAWAKSLEDKGTSVVELPITLSSMPKWIEKRALDLNLKIDKDAINLLSEKTEGNLLATTQELMKLVLLFPLERIDLQMMEKSISNASTYGIFDLSNAFISGDKKRTIRIIEGLKSEGTQPPLILWALSKEIYNLYKVMEEGSPKNIWGPRYYLDQLSKKARNTSRAKIKNSLKDIAEIDTAIKGLSGKNPWQSIRELALNF